MIKEPEIIREADLVCEALVREINRASRWSHVLDAWRALLNVRRIEDELVKEQASQIREGGVSSS